jgi:hypothetical protein
MDDHYLLEEREDDGDGIRNAWTRVDKKTGKAQRREFFTRLYGRRRLSAALRKAGLKPLKFWGGFDGRPLSSKTIRLICLARKA